MDHDPRGERSAGGTVIRHAADAVLPVKAHLLADSENAWNVMVVQHVSLGRLTIQTRIKHFVKGGIKSLPSIPLPLPLLTPPFYTKNWFPRRTFKGDNLVLRAKLD